MRFGVLDIRVCMYVYRYTDTYVRTLFQYDFSYLLSYFFLSFSLCPLSADTRRETQISPDKASAVAVAEEERTRPRQCEATKKEKKKGKNLFLPVRVLQCNLIPLRIHKYEIYKYTQAARIYIYTSVQCVCVRVRA